MPCTAWQPWCCTSSRRDLGLTGVIQNGRSLNTRQRLDGQRGMMATHLWAIRPTAVDSWSEFRVRLNQSCVRSRADHGRVAGMTARHPISISLVAAIKQLVGKLF